MSCCVVESTLVLSALVVYGGHVMPAVDHVIGVVLELLSFVIVEVPVCDGEPLSICRQNFVRVATI